MREISVASHRGWCGHHHPCGLLTAHLLRSLGLSGSTHGEARFRFVPAFWSAMLASSTLRTYVCLLGSQGAAIAEVILRTNIPATEQTGQRPRRHASRRRLRRTTGWHWRPDGDVTRSTSSENYTDSTQNVTRSTDARPPLARELLLGCLLSVKKDTAKDSAQTFTKKYYPIKIFYLWVTRVVKVIWRGSKTSLL